MKLAILLIGLALSTVAILLFGAFHDEWLFYVNIVLFIGAVVLSRDPLARSWWFQPFWSAWIGISFLGAGWLEMHQGMEVSPMFKSFGPGFLVIAVLSIVFPKWFNPRSTQPEKQS
jgi:hypothetical protein